MTAAHDRLKHFISKEMRMSHVYQPVMLIELLKSGGKATVRQIAKAILGKDQSQVEYYEQITKNMVGRVLTKNRKITSKLGDTYTLDEFDRLTPVEVKDLVDLCRQKIAEYEEKRGKAIWAHRNLLHREIPGSVRYEVLKRAKRRCELCGISAEEKALEVDHINPKSWGGPDELDNYQALCFTCNASKRNQDDADLRGVAESYKHRVEACVFCDIDRKRIIAENALAFAVRDAYPVTVYHTLIIPKRHVADYFELYQPEINAMNRLILEQKAVIAQLDPVVSGFNVGANCGEVAGQTIFHCHVHLIPRRAGDVERPRGGVRHVIPGQGSY